MNEFVSETASEPVSEWEANDLPEGNSSTTIAGLRECSMWHQHKDIMATQMGNKWDLKGIP